MSTKLLCKLNYHKWSEWVKFIANRQANEVTRFCKRCGLRRTEKACEVGIHRWGMWVLIEGKRWGRPATEQVRQCKECGFVETRKV